MLPVVVLAVEQAKHVYRTRCRNRSAVQEDKVCAGFLCAETWVGSGLKV